MKTLSCAAFALLMLSGAAAAKPGVAATTVNLRAEANTGAAILAKIPGGARLEVGDCTGEWCAVTYLGKSGFAIATALDTTGRPRAVRRPLGPPPGYDDDFVPAPGYPAYAAGPPVVYYGPGPYWGPRYYGYGPYWGYGRWGGGWRRW